MIFPISQSPNNPKGDWVTRRLGFGDWGTRGLGTKKDKISPISKYPNTQIPISQSPNNPKGGQVLLFVIFLLFIVGIMAAGLARMWGAEVQIPSLQECSSQALYLAEAGIERGKIEILNDVSLAVGWYPGPTDDDWYPDLDDPANPYTYNYNFEIVAVVGTQRTIRGYGQVLDVADAEVGRREIEVTIAGIADTVPPFDGIDDDPSDNSVASWTWRET